MSGSFQANLGRIGQISGEPLIFIEVALLKNVAETIQVFNVFNSYADPNLFIHFLP